MNENKLEAWRRLLMGSGKTTKQWSAEAIKAFLAIRDLVSAEGVESAGKAYSEAVGDAMRDEWEQREGVMLTGGQHCALRLKGEQCSGQHDIQDCRTPSGDHELLYLKDGKPFCFVSHPYGLGLDRLKQIVQFCEEHGLDVGIGRSPSWYYPSGTIMVEYKAAR